MSGNRNGGLKAAQTNREKHGKDFYANIGRIGGRNSHTGGFASKKIGKDGLTGPERAKVWGAIAGRIGKRKAAKYYVK